MLLGVASTGSEATKQVTETVATEGLLMLGMVMAAIVVLLAVLLIIPSLVRRIRALVSEETRGGW